MPPLRGARVIAEQTARAVERVAAEWHVEHAYYHRDGLVRR
jgi:hypothetical protein